MRNNYKRVKELDLQVVKNRRFTNWFYHIHREKVYSKIDLLRIAYKDEAYVKELLYYCYHPEYHYSLKQIAVKVADRITSKGEATDSQYHGYNISSVYKVFISILDKLINKEITKAECRAELYELYRKCNRYTRWVFNRVLDKDMGIGVGYKQVRKAFPDMFKNTSKVQEIRKVTEWYGGGISCEFDLRNRAVIVSGSRYFKLLNYLGNNKRGLANFYGEFPKNCVFDGYFERIKTVKKRVLKRNKHGKFKFKDIIEERLVYVCCDYIPLAEFEQGKSDMPLYERLKILKSLPIYGTDIKLANFTEYNGEQGRLVRSKNSLWGVGRWVYIQVSKK